MKNILSTLFLVTLLYLANSTINAATPQDNGLIRNAEEVNGIIVSETVYKLDGSILTNYMKHNYKYDANNQRIEDEALKWNGTKDCWDKDLCIRYVYSDTSITTEYYKWNKKKKDYILVPEMTVTMDK